MFKSSNRWFAILSFGVLVTISEQSAALQPLKSFLESSETKNLTNLETKANARAASYNKDLTLARLGPSFTAQARWQRNQYPVSIDSGGRTVVIVPRDQLEASLQLDVPLLDLGTFRKYHASKASHAASQSQIKATRLETQRQVAETYYRLIASYALEKASLQTLSVNLHSLSIANQRLEAGSGTLLDVERAKAEVEQAKQSIADAQLLTIVTSRNLQRISGLTPSDGAPDLHDDLHSEAPLSVWMRNSSQHPQVTTAQLQSKAAQENESASKWSWIPTVGAFAQQRFTNATGFQGQSAVFTAGITATWKLDLSTNPTVLAQSAAAEASHYRAQRIQNEINDQIYQAWYQIKTQQAKARSTRAQSKAASHAAQLAKERFTAGTASQLELIQAQRDAFASEVARIQADADLLYARYALRVAAGRM
jgi:outer membrane protein TolC